MSGRPLKFKFLLFLCLLFLMPVQILADSVTFTAQVGDTILILKGYTSANSLVTFTEGGGVKGTTTSDIYGFFEKTFTAQEPGFHQILIYSTDPVGTDTASINKSLFLIGFQSLELNDIILPPSIKINNDNFQQNDLINISGYAKPNSYLEIELRGAVGKLTIVQTDINGFYEYHLDTHDLSAGAYSIVVNLKGNLNENLSSSSELFFNINIKDESAGGGEIIVPGDGEQPGSCIYPYPVLCFFDKLGKGYIDQISEFQRILLGFIKFYQQPISNIFDINEDHIVSVEDLSIALYYTKPDSYQILGVSQDKNADISFNQSGVLGAGVRNPINNVDFLVNLAKDQFILGIILLLIFTILAILRSTIHGASTKSDKYKNRRFH